MATLNTPRGDPAQRFLFYSHDGMGLGHTRRNLAIAAALTRLNPLASVLLATSTDEAHRLGLPQRVEILKLPGLRKAGNDHYHSRRLDVSSDDIRQLRSSLLEAAIKSFRPGVVLVDKHPFGARGELRAGLALLKEQGGRMVLGWRDILDDPATTRSELAAHGLGGLIAEHYDRVLIYGERSVFNPLAQYDVPDAVARRTRFCGYVLNDDPNDSTEVHRHEPTDREPSRLAAGEVPDAAGKLRACGPIRAAATGDRSRPGTAISRPTVLATTGGGEDGFHLLEQFLRAAEGAPWRGIVIAGPMMPPEPLQTLRELAARAEVPLYKFVPRLPALFDRVDALVCMGGYNTLTEAVAHGMPTVCVPRVTPRTEQFIRAQAFERLGLLRMIHPKRLNATSLRAALSAAIRTSRRELRHRVQAALSFDGARQAAEELLVIARAEVPAPELAAVAD
jgi:predicted glycosyltransferase